ncbi:MAG TPA: ROK family protein [Pseudonocardia sp.]|jgi:polyphosphate glucokinase|nr:ROK family protein [Pseudonocardia sp.]
MGKHGFGVDIGGTGIKGAPVDLRKGKLAEERFRVPTPQPATPDAVAGVVREVLDHFDWQGPFGCTFPAVVQHGMVRTAANVDSAWIGTDAHKLLGKVTGRRPLVVNDADAAGLAEVHFGAAKDVEGVVVVSTLGTGIGSALLVDGRLVPNTELGHLEVDGHDAEAGAADSARERENLSWADWAARLTRYFQHLENLFWPDLIVVGGGVSKKADNWLSLVDVRTEIVPAKLLNDAGIVGAAVLAAEQFGAGGRKH